MTTVTTSRENDEETGFELLIGQALEGLASFLASYGIDPAGADDPPTPVPVRLRPAHSF